MDRAIGRVLLAAARQDYDIVAVELGRRPDDPSFCSDLVSAAAYHALVPLLASVLEHFEAPVELASEVASLYRSQTSHVLRLEVLLSSASRALTEAGVRAACYKGPALAHGYYGSPAQRTYSDVDLLVDPTNLETAHEALSEAGFRLSGMDWKEALQTGYGELLYAAPNGTALDLHWHVLREPQVRAGFRVDTTEMLHRSVPLQMSADAAMLDPEDMLIAVAMHACYDGAYRLGWLVDVDRVESRVSYQVLAERCSQTGTGLPVQVVLDRSRAALGTVDEKPRLSRGAWRTMLSALSLIRPIEHTFGQIMRGGVLYRSTRQTTAQSAAAFGRLLVDEVARPVLTNPSHRWRRPKAEREARLGRG